MVGMRGGRDLLQATLPMPLVFLPINVRVQE
jgi:hypothetical protein